MSKKEKIKSKKMNNENNKTDNGKIIKIIGIIAVAVVIIGVGGFFGYKYYKDNQSVGTDWGDTYYSFITESKSDENKDVKIQNDSKIEFVEVPEFEEPIMVVNYEKEEKQYSDIYYINEGTVKNVIELEPSNVEMLYNIEDKKYNWYVHKTTDTEEKYVPVSNTINKTLNESENSEQTDENQTDNKEYTFKKGEEISVDTVDGNKITMTKFDSIFVKPEVEIEQIDYNEDLTDKDLKESMTNIIKEYKTTDEITKEVSKEVEKKETEINTKKDEMKKAEEEVKKKQEEERKKAEEEAKKGFKVGSYTLKYGTYKSNLEGDVVGNNGKYTINQNGTYTYTKDKDREYNQSTKQYFETSVQESGTYEAKTTSNDGVPVLSICFNPTSSNIKQYLYYGNGISEECFEVKSNNSWHGVQYLNDYTYIG